MANGSRLKTLPVGRIHRIVLIGCGGTGSILAEHLARMIAGFRLDTGLTLMDGDRVEESNIWRQNFAAHEVSVNKAEALALRLTGRFGICVGALGAMATAENIAEMQSDGLVITATDSLASRRLIADRFLRVRLWIDAGNEKTFGQAVAGTTHDAADLRKVWWNWNRKKGYVSDLPDIAALRPAILKARSPRQRTGCGRTPFAEQGFGINAMAALAAAMLAKQAVVDGVLGTAAIYFDTDSGRMTPRLIDRELFEKWKHKEKA